MKDSSETQTVVKKIPHARIPFPLFQVANLTLTDITVYSLLTSLSAQKGYCYALNETILKMLGNKISKKTLNRSLQRLKTEGLITCSLNTFSSSKFYTERKIYIKAVPVGLDQIDATPNEPEPTLDQNDKGLGQIVPTLSQNDPTLATNWVGIIPKVNSKEIDNSIPETKTIKTEEEMINSNLKEIVELFTQQEIVKFNQLTYNEKIRVTERFNLDYSNQVILMKLLTDKGLTVQPERKVLPKQKKELDNQSIVQLYEDQQLLNDYGKP